MSSIPRHLDGFIDLVVEAMLREIQKAESVETNAANPGQVMRSVPGDIDGENRILFDK